MGEHLIDPGEGGVRGGPMSDGSMYPEGERPFHESHYTQSREWWVRQAELEHSRNARLQREVTQANAVGDWGREFAIVALRMLERAGKLKATTDDERKAIEWAQQQSAFGRPGANRRLGSPFDDAYEHTADAAAQAVLFDEREERAA